MKDLEISIFEHLKNDIQAQYVKTHTPSSEEISNWKGIDIIYFQEDLRKIAKGNISEKSFYTYFKSSPVNKIPRIDMLNILCVYIGYSSWYEYKKFKQKELNLSPITIFSDKIIEEQIINDNPKNNNLSENKVEIVKELTPNSEKLQINNTDLQLNKDFSPNISNSENNLVKPTTKSSKKYIWGSILGFLAIILGFLGFEESLFISKYTYCFIDADRNSAVQNILDIKVIKDNESPMYFRINPGECFVYPTKDKNIKMLITSPLYENLEITRNLTNAPSEEKIQLKPDDYKTAVYYFSKKDISGNTKEALELIKQKRMELESRISNNAIIYQVYDNDIYGIETMDKQKYITLVTTPTTSLKNLTYIEMKREKGKIISIKFKINSHEK